MRYRKSCVTGAGLEALRVVGTGWATSWWPKSTDSCTGGKSADSVCDGSGNAATTIDSGLSEATVVSVAVPAAGSAAVATSALATTALPIAIGIACGSSASLALAAREAAPFSIGTAPVFSVPAEPKPASQPTITPARMTVPHNAGATVANRRGFMIGRLQRLHLSHAAQPSMRRADFSDQDMTAQWRKLQVINFSKECCPNALRRRQTVLCILRRKRVGKLKGPCDACGRFGGEPAMVNSDQQTRLSGRKRGCRPLERSVVGDL